MPIYKNVQNNEVFELYVWKIEESESWLARDIVLTPHCQDRLEGMKSELHRRGFLSIRHLLAQAGYTDADLYYDEAGKPHLKDGTYISITHSFEFTGIILSKKQEVGIDIEKQRDKILRIAHRFTPVKEYRTLANDQALIRKLTMVWGAKESIYKIMGIHGLSFLNHIRVSEFDMDEGQTSAGVLIKGISGKFEVYFMEFEGFTLAYALSV
ncbi:MAG: 4'-phosphopantetheinyl transferase superfamily protein [Robiginitalea sp.]|uniref:4'-phosphopantetheinyl transferase family protein n=2 Tax=Robiginitalea sp. TaxID=1902411 RepID=UPI003C78D059